MQNPFYKMSPKRDFEYFILHLYVHTTSCTHTHTRMCACIYVYKYIMGYRFYLDVSKIILKCLEDIPSIKYNNNNNNNNNIYLYLLGLNVKMLSIDSRRDFFLLNNLFNSYNCEL
jgi:hypothetical protein